MGEFNFCDEKFADIQMLRFRLNGFEELTARQKAYIYYLAKAALQGRDIITDQNCRHNLRVRKTLEAVYTNFDGDRDGNDFKALETYLKQVWFANGIHHHYGGEKFKPAFTKDFLREAVEKCDKTILPIAGDESVSSFCDEILRIIFDDGVAQKRVVKTDGIDIVKASACNYYENVTQKEAEKFYSDMDCGCGDEKPSFGLNSKLVKRNGELVEEKWTTAGMYGEPLRKICHWLRKAMTVAENKQQEKVIALLIEYYETGDLHLFDTYSIEWLKEQEGRVDFINGFIEVYGDPLGIKASWESLVEYKDMESTRRTRTISDNAQWFEDHSPVDPRFRKPVVKGVSANVICAAMLGGDEYPSSAIGINLPNADWIRARHGSKSVTIGNLTEAYNMAARGNGFYEEFVSDDDTLHLIYKYDDLCDDLHTDLHECLGHGSGRLAEGVDPNALKAYGNTIEEARADLFALYYLADKKIIELGLLNNQEAFKAQYYTYLMNGAMTQLVRIKPGDDIEEDHMRNRALISRWTLEHADGAAALEKCDGKTFLVIHDYDRLRTLFATLLAEIQRIKSEGDYEAAMLLVERYAIHIDKELHEEMLRRYKRLGISPYKGFINPKLVPTFNENGEIENVDVDYTETFEQQMLRYSKEYATL